MADLKPYDYALYLMAEFDAYLEKRAGELSAAELASLLKRLARIVHRLQGQAESKLHHLATALSPPPA